jgi:hypothetical protein
MCRLMLRNSSARSSIPRSVSHRVPEPLTQRILAFFELLGFLLQVVADAFDARERSSIADTY